MLTAVATPSHCSRSVAVTVWFFTRKMFGVPPAIIAGVLIVFDPNVLAHGALVTTDIAASLGFLLTAYAAYRYVIEPTPTRIVALGLATGFAFSVKHSTILLAAILPLLLVSDAALSARMIYGELYFVALAL